MADGDARGSELEDPRYAKALAHPLRVRILAILQAQDASPVQLASRLDASLGTVAYHVRTLERLGLIEMVATHQRRGATEHVYAARRHPRLSSRALTLDARGLEELAAARRRWQEEIARIERAAAERLDGDGAAAIDASVVLLVFEASPASA
ncbi:MAG TPA: winged helix-turn-helix domain-containing protein [Solirubrobacteraceae bacterium]|nr:winged helix-turn-helix domain-containing protein [Solirubrobacteraceae bacterium]